jgi:DNA repair exonuclease SbcCD ATPase subunit
MATLEKLKADFEALKKESEELHQGHQTITKEHLHGQIRRLQKILDDLEACKRAIHVWAIPKLVQYRTLKRHATGALVNLQAAETGALGTHFARQEESSVTQRKVGPATTSLQTDPFTAQASANLSVENVTINSNVPACSATSGPPPTD